MIGIGLCTPHQLAMYTVSRAGFFHPLLQHWQLMGSLIGEILMLSNVMKTQMITEQLYLHL